MIQLSAIKFNNEFRASQDLTFLLGCIGEKVTITLSFYYEDVTYATEDNKVVFAPDGADVDLADTTGVLYSEDGIAFANTFVGDTIGFYHATLGFLFYTVTEKFNDGLIRTTYGTGKSELSPGVEYIFNATPFSGVRYAYNLVASGGTYNSLVDGELQQLQIDSADTTNATPASMAFTGIKSYQIGSATIKGDGGVGGGLVSGQFVQQKFTITHTTYITPLFLASQYADLLLGKKPDYFEAAECLNYIGRIALGRNLKDPNGLQEYEIPVLKSNTGWFNETFNGGATNYAITSVVIKNSSLETVSALAIDDTCTVEIIIQNTTDTPFSNGNTKYIFGINYLPEDEDYYQQTGENLTTNFVFDSKLNTVGSGSANGANYGTGMQVIKSVTSTYTSTSQIKITATIEVGADAKAIIQQGDNYRYMFWVITENHSLSAVKSDKVNLLGQVSEFTETLTTAYLVGDEHIQLIFHPYSDRTITQDPSVQNIHPTDDVVAYFPFFIDFTTHPATEGIKITKVQSKLVLRDSLSVESDIVLEDFTINTSNYPIIGGKAQDINFTQDRVFKIGATEIRKTISLQRDYAKDIGDELHYYLLYPFMLRWEYWEQLIPAVYPAALFDPNEEFNGFNQFLQRLSTASTYELTYEVLLTLEQNGETFQQTFAEALVTDYNFGENPEWDNLTIKTYDSTNNLLSDGSRYFVNGFENTKIVASFEKVSGGIPSAANVGIVIWIETFENGGIKDIRRASSFYDISGDTNAWFTNSSDRVDIAKTGNVYTGTVYLDYTKIPKNVEFTIYARIYDFFNNDAKQFQNGDDFEFQDGTLYEFQ